MKRIVILGGSAAGIKVIEEIRRTDSSSEITIISFDGHYPYKRDAFAPFIAKDIAPENVFCRPKDFFDQNKAQIILDKKISRINLKRKKIFMEDKEQIDYDILIVTDTPENRYPDIKGTTKENVYGYKKLKDIDRMVNDLSIVKTVAIQSNSFAGLQAAVSFNKRGKEVILVTAKDDFLNRHFEPDVVNWITTQLEEKGLRIMQDNCVMEILGDKEAKAVRLQSGKVFSAEIVLFTETDEDLRIFTGSDFKIGKAIQVDNKFQTNIEGVFAVDQTCNQRVSEPVTPVSILEVQGEIVAAVINGQDRGYELPIYCGNTRTDGLVITIVGDIEDSQAAVQKSFDSETATYTAIYRKDNRLIGAILVNKDEEIDGILNCIHQKTDIPVVEPGNIEDAAGIVSENCSDEGAAENVSTELIDN